MTLTANEALKPGAKLEGALGYAWRKGFRSTLRAVAVGLAWEVTVVIVPLLASAPSTRGWCPETGGGFHSGSRRWWSQAR